MASVTVVMVGTETNWKFAYESGDASFEAHVPAPHVSRKDEWVEFLVGEEPTRFVLNEDDGYTTFAKSDKMLGFVHATNSGSTKGDVHVCAKTTLELLEQLCQLPFSE